MSASRLTRPRSVVDWAVIAGVSVCLPVLLIRGMWVVVVGTAVGVVMVLMLVMFVDRVFQLLDR